MNAQNAGLSPARLRRWLTASLIAPSIAMCALMMQGCAASTAPSTGRSTLDASLTTPCPPLERLTEKDGRAALRWMIGAADAYNDCASRHGKLVEAVR